jgi:hypothetical protein
VTAVKCNGDRAVAEIELMPYTEKLNLQPVGISNLWWSPRYPCHNVPYDVWAEVFCFRRNWNFPLVVLV